MGDFAGFVRGFCVVAVSGGLVLTVSPGGNLSKYVKLVISLCMVCALLSAFLTFSENAESFLGKIEAEAGIAAGEAEEEARRRVTAQAKRNMEAELCALIAAHTGAGEEEVYVVAALDTTDFSAVEITEINVFLSDTSKAESVRAFLAEMFAGAVTVNVMHKGE